MVHADSAATRAASGDAAFTDRNDPSQGLMPEPSPPGVSMCLNNDRDRDRDRDRNRVPGRYPFVSTSAIL